MASHLSKYDLLKDTIYQLYSKEGRSISYISRLLHLNRKHLSAKITKVWKFPKAEPRRHATPSTQKFINKNRELIKSRLDHDIPITKIAKELKVTSDYVRKTVIPWDQTLTTAYGAYCNRIHDKAEEQRQKHIEESTWNYEQEDIQGEEWEPILGYSQYMVSSKGRIRKYVSRYHAWHILQQQPNKNNQRLYVRLVNDEEKSKNLQVARLVAHAFVEGKSEKKNTVNHKDGDVNNNNADNLEWASQQENNLHRAQVLKKISPYKRTHNYSKILYKGKYEFKTAEAFARFLGKSATQTRRYLDNPSKYDIELIP